MTSGKSSRKEDSKMNYSKPELFVIGHAKVVIEQVGKASPGTDSALPHNTNPAYDLDE
jgi:hypothetical protein